MKIYEARLLKVADVINQGDAKGLVILKIFKNSIRVTNRLGEVYTTEVGYLPGQAVELVDRK
jgi:hypothetical protein